MESEADLDHLRLRREDLLGELRELRQRIIDSSDIGVYRTIQSSKENLEEELRLLDNREDRLLGRHPRWALAAGEEDDEP